MDDLTGYELVETPWMARAACRGLDPELFFSTRGDNNNDAKAVCRACPVARQCAEYAAVLNQKNGIWGGLSDRKRARPGRPGTLKRLPAPHGTTTRYHGGCRCDRCGEAQAAYGAERRDKETGR